MYLEILFTYLESLIPGIGFLPTISYFLAYLYIVLVNRHFPNYSLLYLIGMASPIPAIVSPHLLYSSFLIWSSLWNAYCFVISFCSLSFCLFVTRAQRLANFLVIVQFYTANSSTVLISFFTHSTRQFTVCCLKFAANKLQCSLPAFQSWWALLYIDCFCI